MAWRWTARGSSILDRIPSANTIPRAARLSAKCLACRTGWPFSARQPRLRAAFKVSPGKSYERIIGFSRAMFEHAFEYRRLNRALLGSNAEIVVRRQIHSALVDLVSQEVKAEFQSRRVANEPVSPELLTHFLVSAYISVLTRWLGAKNPVSPKDIDLAYRNLVIPCLASIFG